MRVNVPLATMLIAICVNASCQVSSRTELGEKPPEASISGTITYLDRPIANAEVVLISYREKKCYRRTAEKIPLYGGGDVEFPKALTLKERDALDECRKLEARGTTDKDGKFRMTARSKRWKLVKIMWGDGSEPKRVLFCKVGQWRIETYAHDANPDRSLVVVQTGLFFLHVLENKQLTLELAKPIGKEGRCRIFQSSANALP